MKGGQLPDLPPEVKAARDTLAAWLNKQKLFRSRDLRAWNAAKKAKEGLERQVESTVNKARPAIVQDIEAAKQEKTGMQFLMMERERVILEVVRPDLEAEECLYLAHFLVQSWTEEGSSEWRPGRRRRKRSPSGPDLPPRTTRPAQLARTLAQLARDVEREPGSYSGKRHREDLLECLHHIDRALLYANATMDRPGR